MAREKPALEVPRMPLCRPTVRWRDGGTVVDRLAVEEPLEIRIDGRPIAVTMRTPGHDAELALGFCTRWTR